MFDHWMHSLTTYLHHNPSMGMFAGFGFSFLESLAIVGSVIPGSVTMTIVGMLMGLGLIPIWKTLILCGIGALIGDALSYWIGLHTQDKLAKWHIMEKYKKSLDQCKTFMHRHGIMSLVIGRFFGPMRSMIPMVAGMLAMPKWKLAIGIIPSAFLWAFVYLLPGVLLGAFSMELPAHVLRTYLEYGLGILIVLGGIVYLLRKTCLWLPKKYQTLYLKLGTWLASRFQAHHRHHRVLAHDLCDLAFLALSIILIVGLVHDPMTPWLNHINTAIYYILQNMQTHTMIDIMTIITSFGNKYLTIPAVTITLLWLFYKKRYRACMYWLLCFASAILISKGLKVWLHIARPPMLAMYLGHQSFPSGHTTLAAITSLCLYRMAPKTKIYWVPIVIILVAFSRLYLGAHWVSDVIAGWLIAIFASTIGNLYLLAYPTKPPVQTLKVFIYALTFSTVIFFGLLGKQEFQLYHSAYPKTSIRYSIWWRSHTTVPVFRKNRVGLPYAPFNVQWAAQDTSDIASQLQGWVIQPIFKNMWHRLKQFPSKNNFYMFPMLPQLYQKHPPALIATYTLPHKVAVLKLWPSNITIKSKQSTNLWIGTLYTIENPDINGKIHVLHHPIHNTVHPLDTLQVTHHKIIYPGDTHTRYPWDHVILKIINDQTTNNPYLSHGKY